MSGTEPASKETSAISLPRWLAKAPRYDVEDIAFSPPEEGAPFFALHMASETEASSPPKYQSTFDRINKELGFSEKTSGVSLGPLETEESPNQITTFGNERRNSSSSLLAELQKFTLQEKSSEETTPVKPLLVLTNPFSKEPALTEEKTDNQSESDSPDSETMNSDGSGANDLKDFAETMDLESEGADKVGLFASVKNFVFSSNSTKTSPYRKTSDPLGLSRRNSSTFTNMNDPDDTNRYPTSGGIIVEKRTSYNAFFYRPESLADVAPTEKSKENRDEVFAAAATMTMPQEERRSLRPKPSRLREMNFMAPTSM